MSEVNNPMQLDGIRQEMMKWMKANFEREQRNKVENLRQMNRYIQKGQTLFTGSSLMEMFPITEYCLNEGLPIAYNRAIGGYTTDDFLAAIDAVLLDPVPAKLFINIGTNDITDRWGDESWFDHLSRNYRKIAEIIREQLPATQVYMLAYYPVNRNHPNMQGNPAFAIRTNENVQKANDMVQALAEEFGFTYLDVNDGLKDAEGNLKMEYALDGVHMCAEAYRTVFERLKPYLK